jgi:hypothetical protein
MNRAAFIILVMILLIGGLAWWFLMPSIAPTMPQQQVGTYPNSYGISIGSSPASAEQEVKITFEQEQAQGHPDNIKTGKTVVVDDWALQLWTGDIMGGEALYHFDTVKSKWVMVEFGGGSWSLEGLVFVGVPQKTAQAIIAARGY